MICCSGLPLCLSGIHILPQNRKRASRGLARSRTVDNVRSSSQEDLRSGTLNSILHRSATADDTGSASPDRESTHSFPSGDDLQWRSSDHLQRNASRFSVAQEMADLDCRREAIRQRLRTLLSSHVDNHLSSSSHLMERFLSNFLEKHLMRLEHMYDYKQKISLCAKAA